MEQENKEEQERIEETERLEFFLHPSRTPFIFGQVKAEQTLLSAYRSDRMPHAWLLQGEKGIGKATLAYRFARFVLTHPNGGTREVAESTNLYIDPESRIFKQITAQSHPDLYVICQDYNLSRKKVSSIISVESVHESLHFLAMTPNDGGWCILIVDAVDNLSISAVNALLKTIEEPADRKLFLLISHVPGTLPATLQSRCRKLTLEGLGEADLKKALDSVGAAEMFYALEQTDQESLISLSRGSVRRALVLLEGKGLALWREVNTLLEQALPLDEARLHALADQMAPSSARADFAQLVEFVREWLIARLHDNIKTTGGGRDVHEDPFLSHISHLWEKVNLLSREIEIFNFDRKRAILDLFYSLVLRRV